MSEFESNNLEFNEVNRFKKFAIQAAKEAGEYILSQHGKIQEIEYKLLTDFKTKVDDYVDQLLRNKISRQYPRHNIYSEELSPQINDSEYAWVYDPLDGTFNFTNGFLNMFSVSIGLVKGKEALMGVVNVPAMKELFWAQKGEGAYINGKKIAVSQTDDVNKAMVAMDFGKLDRQRGVKYYNRMLAPDGVRYPAVYACTSVSMIQVANGRLDAYLASNAEPWDYAGAVPIVREAGGRVTTLEGKEWELGDETILVANPVLHDKLLRMFSEIK
jgi:myo-inositol-1(or 4)-monophosphatase